MGSHFWEYTPFNMQNRPTYEEFCNTILAGKYHGLTLEHVFEKLNEFPYATIIYDTKEEDSFGLLKAMVTKASELDFDIFDRFIIQVYSEKNYQEIKNDEILKNFKHFWYTNYKSNYSPHQILNIFEDKADVEAYVFSYKNWWVAAQVGFSTKKNIAVYVLKDKDTANFLSKRGVDRIYIDYAI